MPTLLDRRAMLGALTATAMTAALPSAADAARRRRFFQRIGRPMGLQLYTLGDEPKADLDATFARVAQLGYRDIELPELYGRTPAQVRAAADRAGLAISSLHVQGEDMFKRGGLSLSSELAVLTDTLGPLGASQAVMPIMLFPEGLRFKSMETFGTDMLAALTAAGPDHWKRTAALLNDRAAALKPHGIAVGYHNHNLEFALVGPETAEPGGDTGWTILARETDPALVHFEVDTGWVAAAGGDPVAFLQRHRGRVRQLHVKDLKPSTRTNFTIAMDPAEVGAGKLDWARILPAAYDAGVRHFYVEQEPPFAIPRMDAAARAAAYLAKLRA